MSDPIRIQIADALLEKAKLFQAKKHVMGSRLAVDLLGDPPHDNWLDIVLSDDAPTDQGSDNVGNEFELTVVFAVWMAGNVQDDRQGKLARRRENVLADLIEVLEGAHDDGTQPDWPEIKNAAGSVVACIEGGATTTLWSRPATNRFGFDVQYSLTYRRKHADARTSY